MFTGGATSQPLGSADNPFRGAVGAASNFLPPGHFRRHGNAEQGYGGNVGLTPGSTPPRSRNSSPRGSPRAGRRSRPLDEEDEPPARRDRSRDHGPPAQEDESSAPATSMPSEWGGRTLKLERLVQESMNEIAKLNSLVMELQGKVNGDHTRLSALESALPERLHQCEGRQATHIEILNGFARNTSEQIASLQHRMNQVESAPSFGGGGATPQSPNFAEPASPTQQFNIGSPISDPFNARASAPQNAQPRTQPNVPNVDPWASAAGRPSVPQSQPARTFNMKDWNASDKKVSKALTLFNGQAQHYRNWSDRMKDHCKEVNCGYGPIFAMIEETKTRISNIRLTMGQLNDGTMVDFKWLSQHMWVFIGKHDNDLHGRRLALTQNEADNGFELWRALFVENEGGAEQVALGGMSNLHSFPQCPRIEDLQHWLGQWQMTRQRYGSDLPETHLKQMFLNMLPESVSHKLRERKDLTTLQQYINEIDADLGRLNDAKLAKIHSQRMTSALKSGSRSPVSALVEEQHESPTVAAASTGSDEINKKLDTLISVLTAKSSPPPRGRRDDKQDNRTRQGSRDRSKSPRGLDPAWEREGKGCLHCGLKGHNRRACMKFKKLLADNNDKLPAGYKGAYEKWKDQKNNTKVAAVADVNDDVDDFAETSLIWSLPTRSNLPSLPCPCCPISNKFAELEDEDSDESEVMAALQQLTSKVRVGAKIPQKQLKKERSLSKQQISQIAQQVKDGTIDLPNLDLESNDDYAAVWALIDSGAGKSCANKSKHFPFVKTANRPSHARMATANGHELKSRGTFSLQAMTAEGQEIKPDFEDTDVEMPIVAVTDISKEDLEVSFRQDQSELVSADTGRRSKFMKRRGVDFMKIYHKKDQCQKSGCDCEQQPSFTRPGTP